MYLSLTFNFHSKHFSSFSLLSILGSLNWIIIGLFRFHWCANKEKKQKCNEQKSFQLQCLIIILSISFLLILKLQIKCYIWNGLNSIEWSKLLSSFYLFKAKSHLILFLWQNRKFLMDVLNFNDWIWVYHLIFLICIQPIHYISFSLIMRTNLSNIYEIVVHRFVVNFFNTSMYECM